MMITIHESCHRNVKLPRPLGEIHCLAFMRQINVGSHIASLLSLLSPTAIPWFVISIDVNAFDGVLIAWRVAHIGVERFKAIPPCLTYLNSSGAVPLVLLGIGI